MYEDGACREQDRSPVLGGVYKKDDDHAKESLQIMYDAGQSVFRGM